MNTLDTKIILEAKNISHRFDYPLFDDIDLTLQEKQTIAIMGTSGSGKSTLLNILCSLLEPKSGKVIYDNKDIFKLSHKELLKIRRDDFGIIFQSHYLFRGFSANENLEIAELLSGKSIEENLTKSLKIDHILNQGIGEISGGQQQRLSIARVLTKQPKIIFADEPTGNLDNETANEVMEVLFDYVNNNNAAMILVTHDNNIANMCDIVYKVENQKLEQIK
jgi:putative ABC transport system ATP-binding protein